MTADRLTLGDSAADAMWVYVDQSEHYKNAGCIAGNPNKTSSFPDWDCAKWAGFGTKFAYIQTGLHSHAYNGTTLAMSKKGSGLNEIVNPCMERYMRTKEYYEVLPEIKNWALFCRCASAHWLILA